MKHSLSAAALISLALAAPAAPAAAAPVVTEFSDGITPNAELGDIVLGPDGKLWFTEKTANKIGRVTPGNPPVIDEFDLPTGFTTPFNITVGHDNKIWFTCSNGAPALCRIDPGNTSATQGQGGYGASGAPAGIAAGPDGAMWLGSQGGTVIRADAGAMTELPASDFTLTGFNIRNLAPGPDGNVWVTDFGGQIARVTPTGTVSPFDVPGDGTWDIVSGPDGNLWYTAPEGNDSKIGRITPAGEFGTQFDVTDAGDQLGITVGPDGAFWFAQAVANNIGRMTTSGQFSVIGGLTAGARPEYIAAGPDDTLWFTEKDGNRIGRITGVVEPPPPLPSPGGTGPDVTRPDVTAFRITRRVFRVGGLGTVIRFTLSEDARVTIVFERRVGRRWRRVRRTMRFQASSGAHRIRFRGRFDLKHPLKPGRYRMTLTARDSAGNVSTPDRTGFRLRPPVRVRG